MSLSPSKLGAGRFWAANHASTFAVSVLILDANTDICVTGADLPGDTGDRPFDDNGTVFPLDWLPLLPTHSELPPPFKVGIEADALSILLAVVLFDSLEVGGCVPVREPGTTEHSFGVCEWPKV